MKGEKVELRATEAPPGARDGKGGGRAVVCLMWTRVSVTESGLSECWHCVAKGGGIAS